MELYSKINNAKCSAYFAYDASGFLQMQRINISISLSITIIIIIILINNNNINNNNERNNVRFSRRLQR